MRSALAAAAITVLLTCVAVLATAVLAGLAAARPHAIPAPTPNQEPRP